MEGGFRTFAAFVKSSGEIRESAHSQFRFNNPMLRLRPKTSIDLTLRFHSAMNGAGLVLALMQAVAKWLRLGAPTRAPGLLLKSFQIDLSNDHGNIFAKTFLLQRSAIPEPFPQVTHTTHGGDWQSRSFASARLGIKLWRWLGQHFCPIILDRQAEAPWEFPDSRPASENVL